MMSVWSVPSHRVTFMELPNAGRDPDAHLIHRVIVSVRHAGELIDTARGDEWLDDAACGRVPDIEGILERCPSCPVKRQCLEYGTSRRLSGPYGGITLHQGRTTDKPTW